MENTQIIMIVATLLHLFIKDKIWDTTMANLKQQIGNVIATFLCTYLVYLFIEAIMVHIDPRYDILICIGYLLGGLSGSQIISSIMDINIGEKIKNKISNEIDKI